MDREMRTAKEYAKFLEDTCWYVHAGEGNALEMAYLMFGLAGEAGETVDAFKKVIRETGFTATKEYIGLMNESGRGKVVGELGDVLWYLVSICRLLGITIEDLMLTNTYKLHNRLIDLGKIPDDHPWPFTDPFKSKENVGEAMGHFPDDFFDDKYDRGEEDVC